MASVNIHAAPNATVVAGQVINGLFPEDRPPIGRYWCLYGLWEQGELVYVGSTSTPRNRLGTHLLYATRDGIKAGIDAWTVQVTFPWGVPCQTPYAARKLLTRAWERVMIEELNPRHNRAFRTDLVVGHVD